MKLQNPTNVVLHNLSLYCDPLYRVSITVSVSAIFRYKSAAPDSYLQVYIYLGSWPYPQHCSAARVQHAAAAGICAAAEAVVAAAAAAVVAAAQLSQCICVRWPAGSGSGSQTKPGHSSVKGRLAETQERRSREFQLDATSADNFGHICRQYLQYICRLLYHMAKMLSKNWI